MTRRERIAFLLEWLPECLSPGLSVTGTGDGDGPGFMLTTRLADHPSVVELLRCLGVLRRTVPRHAEHLTAYYFASWRTSRRPKIVRKKGRHVLVTHADGTPVMEIMWIRDVPAGVELRLVEHGLDMLCGLFNGDPSIPEQLTAAAARVA